MKLLRPSLTLLVICLLNLKSANALGPVDGDVGVGFWNNQAGSSSDLDIGSTVLHGELWLFNKWGVRASQFDSDLEGTDFNNDTRTQIEVRRRFFSAGDNNYFALGLGLEDIDLSSGESTNGIRLSAEARFGLLGPINFLWASFNNPFHGQ